MNIQFRDKILFQIFICQNKDQDGALHEEGRTGWDPLEVELQLGAALWVFWKGSQPKDKRKPHSDGPSGPLKEVHSRTTFSKMKTHQETIQAECGSWEKVFQVRDSISK